MRSTIVFFIALAACVDGGSNQGDDEPPPPQQVCQDSCKYAHDNECDDGGPNADTQECAYGTDCADCGPRPQQTTTCTCDKTNACDAGCLCDPECGDKALGASCTCSGGADTCSDTACSSNYCLWDNGYEGYCSQQCGSCPSGFRCVDFVGLGNWCQKIETVPACGSCTDSSDCLSFETSGGYSVMAACFNGRCRMRCGSSSSCNCVTATPMGGNATGYCSDDGC